MNWLKNGHEEGWVKSWKLVHLHNGVRIVLKLLKIKFIKGLKKIKVLVKSIC